MMALQDFFLMNKDTKLTKEHERYTSARCSIEQAVMTLQEVCRCLWYEMVRKGNGGDAKE